MLDGHQPLPPLPPAWRGLVGPAVWRETRLPIELRRLRLARVELDALVPAGQGRQVVLVPGFFAGPTSMRQIHLWLDRAGYRVSVADIGRNWRSSSWALDQVVEAIDTAVDDAGVIDAEASAIVIGHSRGGQQARVAVGRRATSIGRLITLGAPVRHHLPRGLAMRASVEGLRLLGRSPIGPSANVTADARYERELFDPFPDGVEWTSIYSKSDGVVEWQACLDLQATPVEVDASHVGLTAGVPAFRAIAAALG